MRVPTSGSQWRFLNSIAGGGPKLPGAERKAIRFRIPKGEGFPLLWKERSARRRIAETLPYMRDSVSNMWKDKVRSQDAAILDYAVRNRLLRGPGPTAEAHGDTYAPEGPRAERRRRRRCVGAPRAAARAEGIYRMIAPPAQKYPFQAVTVIRRLLDEGARDEFVQGNYQTHIRCCCEIGVPSMPLIPYLAELLEVYLLDSRAARRNGSARKRSIL